MLYALFIVFFAHTALAATCSPSEDVSCTPEEGDTFALEAVFGTTNPQKLLEIAVDPAAYWNEREKALQDETMSHREFCKTYTQEAKLFLTNPTLHAFPCIPQPWFYKNVNAIEAAVKSKVTEDHPGYPTILASCTTCACDYIMHQPKQFEWVAEKAEFMEYIDAFLLTSKSVLDQWNTTLRWMRKNTEASIFDSLIMLHNKEYLCTAKTFKQITGFEAYTTEQGRLIRCNGFIGPDGLVDLKKIEGCDLTGFSDPIECDVLRSYRGHQRLSSTCLHKYGVDRQEYFRRCWNKEKLVRNDIVSLAQQALGCFYQFRALPATPGSWRQQCVASCVFPYAEELTDPRLLKIVPYFWLNDQCPNDRTDTSNPVDMDARNIMLELEKLRSTYCGRAGCELIQDSIPSDQNRKRTH